jgi:hypothetical protein
VREKEEMLHISAQCFAQEMEIHVCDSCQLRSRGLQAQRQQPAVFCSKYVCFCEAQTCWVIFFLVVL